jgi:hypothetical protein
MTTTGVAGGGRGRQSNERPIMPRARRTREEVHTTERRRRKKGTLDRMAQFKLDIFENAQLDPAYIYRWVSDEGARLRIVTKQDDYDFVQEDEIPDFSTDDMTDSEPGGRLRIIAGEKKNGQPLYQYLVKKRRDFWEDDNADAMDYRDDVLAGRVYRGELNDVPVALAKDGEVRKGAVGGVSEEDQFYVPPEATLGDVGRRRGRPPGKRTGPVSTPA